VSVALEDEMTEQFAFPCEASRIFCVCLEKQDIEIKTPARRRAEILLINGRGWNIMPGVFAFRKYAVSGEQRIVEIRLICP
jgi:hypothetical protein